MNRAGAGAFQVLVLLDGEPELWLAEVRFGNPPVVGDVFHFHGAPWQVVRVDHCGCQAMPVVM